MTRDEWGQIRRAIQRSHQPLRAPNREQAYRTAFRSDGIEIVSQAPGSTPWRLGLSVDGYGYRGDVRPLRPSEPQALESRVEYRRGPLTEWYVNGPEGLEQGFELDQPEPRRREPLVVAMAIQGSLAVSSDGGSASFSDASGGVRIRYVGLRAWDANGRPLAARVDAQDREVRLVVDADEARFPVTVDPVFVHEAQLLGHGDPIGQAGDLFGRSVSISGDTVVVGALFDDTPGGEAAGSAYVFLRSGTSWTEQQKLLPSDGAAGDAFGWSVSVSGDTAVIGAPFHGNLGGADAGSAYVFVRSGTTWTEQQKLLASDGAGGDSFGSSTSISGDTVVVGARSADTPGSLNAGSAYVFVRSGTSWTEQQKLLASDGAAGDSFGFSASVSGDTAVVGARLADIPGGLNAGSAYVFVRSGTTWTEQQKLLASDGAARDRFGESVSASGDTVVVGAPTRDTPGAAYVFVRSSTTWTEQQKLLASDGAAGDAFGFSVSVSGDTVVAGARLHDTPGGADTGSAYVFVRSGTTWTEQQKLLASDGAAGDSFGFSVSVSGDTAVIGVRFHDTPGGADAGSAYVFFRSGTTWTEQQKLLGSDGMAGDAFGFSVSVSGDTAVVGAKYDDTASGLDAGSAYVFVRSGSTWTEQQKLMASDGSGGDQFGHSVSISGDTVVVGAYADDTPLQDAGSAYVFVRSGTAWTEQQKLLAPNAASYDEFGHSVSVFGNTAVVGARYHDTPGGDAAGSAYVFVRSGPTWSLQQQLLAADGAGGDYFGWSVAASEDTAVIGAPGHTTPGILFVGSAYVFTRSGTTWTEQQKLLAPDGAGGDFFGHSVSVSGDTLLVGANLDDTPGEDAGSAYVFVRSGTNWALQQKLLASDETPFDNFGYSVSVSGDMAVVGAPFDNNVGGADAGSAYVFVRSGTTWMEQQKLLAPLGVAIAEFGSSVSLSGATVVVGAPFDDIPGDLNGGSAHVFQGEQADLSATNTDGQTTAVPGQPATYTITASNAGPSMAIGASLTDVVPAALQGATWTCTASPGSTCSPSGSGNINDTVDLLIGGTATYVLTGSIDPSATGTLVNTATVTASPGTDPDPSDNSATDVDTLTPQADLSVTKTDGQPTATPGQPVTYTITVANGGPSDVSAATVTDAPPVLLLGATWTCSASPGSTCAASGSGGIDDVVHLLVGGTATYTLTATVDPAATGTLVNTAAVAVPVGVTDPNPANDSATDSDALPPVGIPIEGELAHGSRRQYDLAALPGPFADEDWFRILQRAHASYEVLLDAASGDLGSGSGPLLERLASDASTVLQTSSPAGAGGSRSLRWMNALATAVADQLIRVRSAGCTTDCAAADVYSLSALETTGFIPRFNNSGTQITVLVLQNPGEEAVDVDVRFWSGTGVSLGGPANQTLGPRQSYVLNTSTIAPGSSGSITVANTGRYGQLTGKAVAVEPATGFTFDSALMPRAR